MVAEAAAAAMAREGGTMFSMHNFASSPAQTGAPFFGLPLARFLHFSTLSAAAEQTPCQGHPNRSGWGKEREFVDGTRSEMAHWPNGHGPAG